eukprot:CFRG4640T1
MSTTRIEKEKENTSLAADTKKTKRLVVVVTLVFVVAILAPAWWYTTTVYRAALPLKDMSTNQHDTVRMPVNFTLYDMSTDGFTSGLDISRLVKSVEERLGKKSAFVLGQGTSNDARIEFAVKEGKYSLQTRHIRDMASLDDDLNRRYPSNPGSYSVFLRPSEEGMSTYVGNHRHAVVSFNEFELDVLTNEVKSVLTRIVDSARADSIKMVKPLPRYLIRVSILVADTSVHRLHWNAEKSISSVFQPMIAKLAGVAKLTYSSQVLYQAALDEERLQLRFDAEKAKYFLLPSDLHSFVDPVAWNLGTQTSDTTYNFLLYIPSFKESPLCIRDENSQSAESHSFFLPRWGGVVIANPKPCEDNSTASTAVLTIPDSTVESAFSIFRSYIRKLISVTPQDELTGEVAQTSIRDVDVSGLRTWEVDALQRRRIVQYVDSAFSSMSSLSRLVDGIGSMVIGDHLVAAVVESLSQIRVVYSALGNGSYGLALKAAESAYESAEVAFFDPSILELLYFPDENKFAIYLPLFMPLGVSLLVSIKKLFT